MNTHYPVTLLILLCLAFAACATPPAAGPAGLPPATPLPGVAAGEAWATAQAAQTQAQLLAQRATAEAQLAAAAAAAATAEVENAIRGTLQSQQATATVTAGTATAVYAATADALAFRATDVAIQATATAVAAQAMAEQRLIDDEMRRLALQRAQEQAALDYQRQINRLKPVLWTVVALAALMAAVGFVWYLTRRAQPVVIPDPIHGPRVLIPAGSYQVLPPPPRAALPPPAAEPPPASPTAALLPPLATGHVLIAGETGSGKSTAMMAVLARRQQVVVLDPHDDGHTWGGARVIGGGRDFDAIGSFMARMQAMLSERYTARSQGQRRFDPLTVATDEMPAIVSALGREMEDVWRTWLREGRKVGLFFVVSTQSTRVKTLGIRGEGDLLENFTYVLLLGKVATAEFPELVTGMARPAVLQAGAAVRPVVIPYGDDAPSALGAGATSGAAILLPEGANGSGHSPHNGGATRIVLPGSQAGGHPTFVAPAPRYADPTQLTPAVMARIRELRAAGHSQRAIETAVFGYTGGAAYLAVRQALQ